VCTGITITVPLSLEQGASSLWIRSLYISQSRTSKKYHERKEEDKEMKVKLTHKKISTYPSKYLLQQCQVTNFSGEINI
jgi:hypothetical protein